MSRRSIWLLRPAANVGVAISSELYLQFSAVRHKHTVDHPTTPPGQDCIAHAILPTAAPPPPPLPLPLFLSLHLSLSLPLSPSAGGKATYMAPTLPHAALEGNLSAAPQL
jgi:hypothetical protein